jgi:4-amino-4-deoxy-L-arabinose transferase-like glycosyltransferase
MQLDNPGTTACLSSRIASVLAALFAAIACLGAIRNIDWSSGVVPFSLAYIVLAGTFSWAVTRWPRRAIWFCVLLGAIAFGLRLAWTLSTAFPPPGDDYEYYRKVSLEMMRGNYRELIATFWPWGYFLYLSCLGRIFGPSLLVPLIANSVLGTATVFLVYGLARSLSGERNGRFAAALYALWPSVIYWQSILCTEIPHLFLFLAAFLCLVRGRKTNARTKPWLVAGGVLAAMAEFVRAVSPLLLIPFAWFALRRPSPGRRWISAGTALGTYLLTMIALLGAQSIASGYPTWSTSKTLGINLAYGLNQETGGQFHMGDALAMARKDPRETGRAGMETAKRRLDELIQSGWQSFPKLAARKFATMWSTEDAGLYAVLSDIPAAESHWLKRNEEKFYGVAHLYHTTLLLLAAVGFWWKRNSGELELAAGIFLAFIALHTVLEVDSRYHFAAQALLAIAASGALRHCRLKPTRFISE